LGETGGSELESLFCEKMTHEGVETCCGEKGSVNIKGILARLSLNTSKHISNLQIYTRSGEGPFDTEAMDLHQTLMTEGKEINRLHYGKRI